MRLAQHLEDIQRRLHRGDYPNESAISQGVVVRVLGALGWPVFDPHVVYPEFSVKGRRVDFALCHPPDRPRVFVEVKQPGQAKGADQQLFEYAFHDGVPMAVMTDGREWHVYVPAGAGSYDERRVYKLDLLDRAPDEAAERLARYLDYDRVRTEEAIRAARDDYDRIARSREGERHLPAAWAALLAAPDPTLVTLVAEKVESLCGVRPDEARVEAFLREVSDRRIAHPPPVPARPSPSPRPPGPAAPPAWQDPKEHSENLPKGVTLDGRFYPVSSATQGLTTVFRALCERDPQFAERFAGRKHGKKRRYVARTREELFPELEELRQTCVRELPGGWLLGLNVSRSEIEKRLRMACEVAGLRYGHDLIVRL